MLWCFLLLCVYECASKCGSVPFHPPLVAIRLLTTEGKVKVLQTKRQNVLTRASSDKRSEECGLRQGCSESRYTINCLAQMNRLGLLTNTPLFYFFSSSPPPPLSLLPLFLFLSSFFRGLSAIKAQGIDFLILSFPSFLLFNTPLPSPTPCSPNQYSICM